MIITNLFLRKVTDPPIEYIYYKKLSSKEALEEDARTEKKALEHYSDKLIDEKLWNLLRNSSNDDEKYVLLGFASIYFYLMELPNQRDELRDQKRLCDQILKSDLVQRDISLRIAIETEKRKLNAAINTRIDRFAIKVLYDEFSKISPRWKKKQIAIRISEILHYLEIHEGEPYLTLEEANDLADRNSRSNPYYLQTGERIIYDRVKKYFPKKVNP